MKRKGQIQNVFIYITAMIVIAAVLLLGYGFVKDLLNKGCSAEQQAFQVNLNKLLNTYNSHGSVNREFLQLPCDFTEICFVDTARIDTPIDMLPEYSIIEQSVESGVERNIFLIGKTIEPLQYNDKVAVVRDEDYFCEKARSGRVKIVFTGKGRTVELDRGVY